MERPQPLRPLRKCGTNRESKETNENRRHKLKPTEPRWGGEGSGKRTHPAGRRPARVLTAPFLGAVCEVISVEAAGGCKRTHDDGNRGGEVECLTAASPQMRMRMILRGFRFLLRLTTQWGAGACLKLP